jgi:DNA-binding transcriptional MerR regulator
MISPEKTKSGQRVYRRTDVETVFMIKHLLYEERYSIEGARKRIRELRKEGGLKEFRKEKVALQTEPSPTLAENSKQMQSLIRELRSLARTPISELFKD